MCMKNHEQHENINPCCFSCCEEKEFITDKLCCDFTVTGTTQETANTIFTGDPSISCNLVASGSIKNCGTDILGVEFVRGVSATTGLGGTVVRTIIIPAGGCATFTVSRFDVIRVASTTVPSTGELCIVQRFPVS